MARAADPADIRAWRRRSDAVTTSGRLEPHDPERLAAIGVRHVINLALGDHPEALPDEAGRLAALGIGYTHIPVPFDAPTRAHYSAFRAALAEADGPVHAHCIMNYRVSAFFYLLDLENGVDEATARERMAQVWDPFAASEPAARPWAELLQRPA